MESEQVAETHLSGWVVLIPKIGGVSVANLTSFKDVVNEKFFDRIYQELGTHVEDNPGELECFTSLVQDPTEATLEDMEIKLLDITSTTSNELRLDVVVSAEIEIKERHRSDVESDVAGQWFRVACSCDVADGIKNFRIHKFSIYHPDHSRKLGQLSDYLIPNIYQRPVGFCSCKLPPAILPGGVRSAHPTQCRNLGGAYGPDCPAGASHQEQFSVWTDILCG